MKNFSDLGVEQSLLNAIQELGFENPTPIQEQTIPVFLETGRDILGLAQTGTGKTAAFGLPILQLLDPSAKHIQSLIICPTRELCMQISRDLASYSKHKPGINTVAVYGGASIERQISDIRRGAHIIVATPGRLMDLMKRKAININQVNFVVLDEADEMLNMGFEEDVEYILGHTPETKRVCLFSATMPKAIRNIANRYMNDAVEISVGKSNSGNVNITHQYSVVHARDKYAALKRYVDFNSDNLYCIIFCTTKNETQDISDKLIKDGYNADCLHGDLSQAQREKVMNRFRHHAIKILLATDVAARGIDVSGLTHVIHFHLPDDIENYTHRSGRTGRAGKLGVSFTLLHMREGGRLKDIERISNIKFEKVLIPSAQDVRDKKLVAFTDTIINTEIEESIFDTQVMGSLTSLMELEKEELLKKFLSLELRRFSVDFANEPDLNSSAGASDRGARDGGGRAARGTRIFVSLGKKDGFDIRSFKDWVAEASNVSWKDLHVDVSGVYSFVDAKDENVASIVASLNGTTYKDRPVRAEVSGDKRSGGGSFGGGERRSRGGSFEGGGDRRRSGGSYEGGGDRRSSGSYEGGGDRRRSSSSSDDRPPRTFGGGEGRSRDTARRSEGSSFGGDRRRSENRGEGSRGGERRPRRRMD
ncbi:MAG: DEAD/DEAH box helicase [Bacteroidia bacterium]|nr:DEAD/DEAH box helicase [Bacteroidia bacterium]MCF8427456.1 DEAD/DEAH box helicase [Bacteroidia bacterium]